MGLLSNKLRNWADPASGQEGLTYWCQGCQSAHTIRTKGEHSWGWNGDVERPVFTPSVLIRTYRYPTPYEPDSNSEHAEIRAKFEDPAIDGHEWMMGHPKWGYRCHTFVGCNGAQPGEVIFLSDCTHALAGQVHPFPDLPEWMRSGA